MNRILLLFSIAIFSIFLGSQIAEGCLLVPYWKSLSATEFYTYYSKFGPAIGKFFTILTITAVLIPIAVSIYCYSNKSSALKYSLASTFFAVLIIVLFYVYFKDMNQQFYDSAFNSQQLKAELISWGNWHWLRVIFEFLSLIFLILALNILLQRRSSEYE